MKIKWIINAVIVLLLISAVLFIWSKLSRPGLFVRHQEESSMVLLEKIEKVVKLVAVEANISEIYDYKDYYPVDLAPFRKKVLVRVKARVSAGYNFDNMKVEINEEMRTVRILQFPEPEILSIDHDLDYYDISQGTFNRFTPEDYNTINAQAKQFVVEKAKDSRIIEEAEKQKEEILDMIRFLIQASGWTLVVDERVLLD